MWTAITRKQFARGGLLLPSDLTDGEWAVLEPLLPPRSKLGRPPFWGYRQIVEALLGLCLGVMLFRQFQNFFVRMELVIAMTLYVVVPGYFIFMFH